MKLLGVSALLAFLTLDLICATRNHSNHSRVVHADALAYPQLRVADRPRPGFDIPDQRKLLHRDWVSANNARLIVWGVLITMGACSVFCCVDSARLSKSKLAQMEVYDSMSYKGSALLSWTAFAKHGLGTIMTSDSLWIMIRRFTAVSAGVAVIELLLTRDPSSLDPMRFAAMGSSLRVFVGFLLGFFLSATVHRWLHCVNAFLDLFNAIRNLQMQLHALGVSQDKVDLVMRYGVLSAWLHDHSLKGDGNGPEKKKEWMDKVWEQLEEDNHPYVKANAAEIALLRNASDPSSHIWLLVGSLIGRMAQDGEIPPMASPTYGRIIHLVQHAQSSLKEVRQSGFVQVPFVYTHTLAIIVHLNNMVAVISFGLTFGACMGSIMVHLDPDLRLYSDQPHPHHILIEDFQDLIIQFFKCFFAPILYQACLEIGISIANPFSMGGSTIPTERLFQELIDDIAVSNNIAKHPPLWEKPMFKAPPVAAAAAPAPTPPSKA